MTELHGRLLVGGELVEGRLHLAGERIARVELTGTTHGELPIVAPGLVDLHVHGFGGHEPAVDLAGMALALARAGTTAFQPTLFPAEPGHLGETAERVWAAAGRVDASADRARAVGLHLEGPFVNPERAGALPRAALAEPSLDGLRKILGPATGGGRGIRTMTLAPELFGSAELVAELARCGVRVSLGHSSASAAEARRAARSGAAAGSAVGATHLFNAMAPLHHREVGLAGFALTDGAIHVELIGDLVHVAAEAVELALAARGPAGLCLVSDALPGAGTGCDVFHWHGREHTIRNGAAWYATEGGELALTGTAMGQLDMVRRLVGAGAVALSDALRMASTTPAEALGLAGELGSLAPGARADLIVLRGAELALEQVWVGGRPLETP